MTTNPAQALRAFEALDRPDCQVSGMLEDEDDYFATWELVPPYTRVDCRPWLRLRRQGNRQALVGRTGRGAGQDGRDGACSTEAIFPRRQPVRHR